MPRHKYRELSFISADRIELKRQYFVQKFTQHFVAKVLAYKAEAFGDILPTVGKDASIAMYIFGLGGEALGKSPIASEAAIIFRLAQDIIAASSKAWHKGKANQVYRALIETPNLTVLERNRILNHFFAVYDNISMGARLCIVSGL